MDELFGNPHEVSSFIFAKKKYLVVSVSVQSNLTGSEYTLQVLLNVSSNCSASDVTEVHRSSYTAWHNRHTTLPTRNYSPSVSYINYIVSIIKLSSIH